MFSLLGTSTTNYDRGHSLLLSLTMENHRNYLYGNTSEQKSALVDLKRLAENVKYLPAQNVLKNEGIVHEKDNSNDCYLCHGIFSITEKFIDEAINKLEDLEFSSFLIGTKPKPHIVNREDTFKTEFKILEAEAFKSHFNRVIGKILMERLHKTPKFARPDIVIIYSLDYESFEIELLLKSVFIFGRYNKFLRGIPQTHWSCRHCIGKGCRFCNYTGKQYQISVEELISPEFNKKAKTTESKFHGAGREDIDVRMLGSGRPFVLELKNPKVRNLDLTRLAKKVNKINRKKIKIQELRYSNKIEVIKLKTEAKDTKKIYRAKIKSSNKISKEDFVKSSQQLKKSLEKKEIRQRTPRRVSHRRADKTRKKIIHKIEGKFIKNNLFEFIIETQGGTYIKELISGDDGRTSPSFSEIFGIPLVCKELDVLEISS